MYEGTKLGEEAHFLPPDLCEFYHGTNGAGIGRGDVTASACRIVPVNQLERLEWGGATQSSRDSGWPNEKIWYRLAWLADGSWLAINPSPAPTDVVRERYRELADQGDHRGCDCIAAICHCSEKTQDRPGQNPVVAISFTELLEKLLDNGGHLDCLVSRSDYGDAEAYTRR